MTEFQMNEILSKYTDSKREYLIPMLQDVQDVQGFISKDAVKIIGRHLNLPSSKIYGVATFYNQFRFNSPGKYHIQVCRGTACHVKGSSNVLDALQRELKIKAGETTRDGLFSIEVVACLGACGLAPVICINGEFYANVDNAKIYALVKKIRKSAAEENDVKA
jgi:NADH-quinone oxidoreductase subunit E